MDDGPGVDVDWLTAAALARSAPPAADPRAAYCLDDWLVADAFEFPARAPPAARGLQPGQPGPAPPPPPDYGTHRTTSPRSPPQPSRHGATADSTPWQPSPYGPPAALPTMGADFAFTSPARHPDHHPDHHHPLQLAPSAAPHLPDHHHHHHQLLHGDPAPRRPDYLDFDVSLSALDVDSSPASSPDDRGNASPMETMTMTMTSGRTSTKRSSPSSTPTAAPAHQRYSHQPSADEPAPKRALRHRSAATTRRSSASLSATSSTYPSPPDTMPGAPASDSHHRKPSSSTGTTRLPHNQVEKKYREGLNTELERLRRAVPTLPQRAAGSGSADSEYIGGGPPKPSKATILASAVDYIKYLEQENERLTGLNEDLRGGGEGRGASGGGGSAGFGWRRGVGGRGEW